MSEIEDFINDVKPDPLREAQMLRHRLNIINQMATPDGRRFVNAVLGLCDLNSNANSGDTNATFFKLGEQNVGQRLVLDITDKCPEHYFTMLKEAKEDDDRDTAEHTGNASE